MTSSGLSLTPRSRSPSRDTTLEVTELLGMETLVFRPHRRQGRLRPRESRRRRACEGVRMRLAAGVDNMHLIEDASGR